MKYEIVEAESTASLDEQVNNMIKIGFVPQGGASVSIVFESYENDRKGYTENSTSCTYVQAMIKVNA